MVLLIFHILFLEDDYPSWHWYSFLQDLGSRCAYVCRHWHECKCACRAQNDAFRNDIVQEVMSSIDRMCSRRNLGCLVQRVHDAEAVQCSPALVQGLVAAVKDSEQASMHLV